MKHKYTQDELLIALNSALNNNAAVKLSCSMKSNVWHVQEQYRKCLASDFLEFLPEPTLPTADGKTPGEVFWQTWANIPPIASVNWDHIANKEAWEAGASAVLAAFGGAGLAAAIARMEAVSAKELEAVFMSNRAAANEDLENVRASLIAAARGEDSQPAAVDLREALAIANKSADEQMRYKREAEARAEKAEAELANAKEIIMAMQHVKESLPRLLPLALAGPVPDGAIRLTGGKSTDGLFEFAEAPSTAFDTVFIDIYPPEDVKLATFEAHGKTWTRHTPGDKRPCELNRSVDVITQKHIDDKNWYSRPHDSSYWKWGHETKIIGWRYADEPAQPWRLPEPPQGRQWHRTDWTEEMLPEGWRPLLEGEKLQVDDWTDIVHEVMGCAGQTPEEHLNGRPCFCRTSRPLHEIQPAQPLAEPWKPKVGESVWLKCGSPEMTVMDIEENNEFWCCWFDGRTILGSDFQLAALSNVNTK